MKIMICAGIAALVSLGGCASTRPVEGPVRLGQMAYVDGPRVRVDEVIEDSRCPGDVLCVWAGRLIVRATVFGGGWEKQIRMTLGEPVQVADGALTLVGATPVPTRRKPTESPEPYRFTFTFQGGF
ncbi:hypothetical protein [Sphingomonas sp.]|jgi:hypothetical protein|uniref:hypothetical protein n=1 Tax=Sphingomonas sp. TaxID=28214 RepID=UPI0026385C8A|nr:hypothetical protein [Sphingomonas sp.]MDF2605756.1 hypothetical protein [Sphingomonas sp.]